MTYQPDLWEQSMVKHKSPTQTNAILGWLQAGRTITPLEALELFGCMRLAARIHELRALGHAISETKVTTRSGKKIAEYRLLLSL